MPRLIAIIRNPLAISALVCSRTHDFAIDAPEWRHGYRQDRVALASLSETLCPWRDKDVKAWRALAKVPALGGRAALAIVRALIGSVADPETTTSGLPPPSFATSADLRPYLCGSEGEELLLSRLDKTLDEATAGLDFPDWHWRQRQDIAALPAGFRESFLWGLHLSPWEMVRVTHAIYDQLELDHDTDLRRAMSLLLSLAERRLGVGWAEVICNCEPQQRARAVELVIETSAYARAPSDAIGTAIAEHNWDDAAALIDEDS
jgi:hypothetical protein